MTDPVDRDTLHTIVDREQDAVLTDPQSIALAVSEFLNLGVTRCDRQPLNSFEQEAPVGLRDRAQVLLDAPVVGERVHALEKPLPLQALDERGVGDRATTRVDGSFELEGVFPVLGKTEELSVGWQRQDHRLRPAMPINKEMIRLHANRHRHHDLLAKRSIGVC